MFDHFVVWAEQIKELSGEEKGLVIGYLMGRIAGLVRGGIDEAEQIFDQAIYHVKQLSDEDIP